MLDINHIAASQHMTQPAPKTSASSSPAILPDKRETASTSRRTIQPTRYTISGKLIHIFWLKVRDDKQKDQDKSAETELIFPREGLKSFSFSNEATILDYHQDETASLTVTVLPSARQITATLNHNSQNLGQSSVFVVPLSLGYKIPKAGSYLFSDFIKACWQMDRTIHYKQKIQQTAKTLPSPSTTKPVIVKAQEQLPILPPKKNTLDLSNKSPLQQPQTKPPAVKVNTKKARKNSQLALFAPAKLLNKQLLPTSLVKLRQNTSDKKILNTFLRYKKKKILGKITPRIKQGTSLSALYPDYRNYTLIKKKSIYKDQIIEANHVQSGYYIWQEDDKIITASSTSLMPLRVAENILQTHMTDTPSSPRGLYLKQIDETYKMAMKKPFYLNQQSLKRLRVLLKKVRLELIKNNSNNALSPIEYGRLLTHIRSWITYDYLKQFSVSQFHHYFKSIGKIQGRGRYTHSKLTQILGLQDTGRIVPNRDFLNHFHYAIENAAKKHPTIPKEWIKQIIWIETKGDPRSISHAGAYGLMQLLPDVFLGKGEARAKSHKLAFAHSINPFNPEHNIERGTAFLESLIAYFGDTIKGYPIKTKKQIIFHAYNRGPTKVKQLLKQYGLAYVNHLPRETKLYLSRLNDYPA